MCPGCTGDLTSVSLHDAYPELDEQYPAPRWGHPKDRRPDLKQIQTGLAVSGAGGIPVSRHAYAGGAAEVAQVARAMTALQQIPGPRPFLLVGDSKLISYTNATAMKASRRWPRPGSRPVIRRAPAGGGHAGGLHRRA
jgi:transposase